MINVSDNRSRNIVLKYKMPLIKGENSIFSIDCLYANERAPIPKRSCAYTRFETHFILTNKQIQNLCEILRCEIFRKSYTSLFTSTRTVPNFTHNYILTPYELLTFLFVFFMLPYSLRLKKNAEENQCNADVEGEVDFTTFAKDEESQDDGITRFEVIGQVDSKGRKALQGLDLQEIHANGTEQRMTAHEPKVRSFWNNHNRLL